jgi:hypothetical protein
MIKKTINGRPTGISAFIIVVDDNIRWLGPSIESIMPVCDEVVVLSMGESNKTDEIVKSFTAYKIKKIDGPAPQITSDNCPKKETYENFRKWAIINSRYSNIFEWGPDMLLIQKCITDDLHEWFTVNDLVKIRGYNVTSRNLNRIAKEDPYTKLETRLFKVKKEKEKPIKKIEDLLKAKKIKEPIYLNTSNINNSTKKDIKIELDLPNFFFKKPEEYI